MGRAHEFETILNVAQSLSYVEDITFLFIGSGAKQAWIMREVSERGLNNVVFNPYQPRDLLALSLCVPDVHPISLYPSPKGLIVPSKFYGVAVAGWPTIFIGGKNGEISRILQEAQCGFSVEKGQAEELSQVKNPALPGGAFVNQEGIYLRFATGCHSSLPYWAGHSGRLW